SPIPYGVQDTFTLRVEKFMDGQLGTLGIEGRILREFGDLERLGPLEDYGVSLVWQR
ncbi:MAG: hypothetical protein HKN21_15125, partial [Candidatus Eisenbacteria bacterium]|nr:hypothetical protein [Candidatus Eisenbacteria bacterium]